MSTRCAPSIDDEGTRGAMASALTIVDSPRAMSASSRQVGRCSTGGNRVRMTPPWCRLATTADDISFVCDGLGAQSEIGGGGRYDGWI